MAGPLAAREPADIRLQDEAALCESWEALDDGRAFRFRLRPGVTFSDGHALTSAAVQCSFERAVRRGGGLRAAFAAIEGVDAFRAGAAEHIAGLKALSPDELEVRLQERLPIYPALLVDPGTAVARETGGVALDAPAVVGTGPFVLARQGGCDIITPMILGERVRLRRVEREDLARFTAWLNDPEVRRHLALVYPMGMANEEAWFEAQLKAEPAVQPYSLDVRALSTGAAGPDPAWTHVGGAGFHTVDWPGRCAELGIVLGSRESWGQGYGTDATRALVGWGFRELNLNRVWLRVFEDNARGIRCYEKVGFRLEGRLRQDRFREGRYLDTLVMGVLRDEFQDPGAA